MSFSHGKALEAHQSRATSFPDACAGRVRGRAEFETGDLSAQTGGLSRTRTWRCLRHLCVRFDLWLTAGCLKPSQVEDVVTVTTAATYSEELATCLEDAEDEQALDQLSSICCKTLNSIKPQTSCRPSKEGQYWLALGRVSATLGTVLKALPDGDELWDQICDPLKPANGFEQSVQFVNGAHQASRIQFWEMAVAHIKIIEEALQGCSVSTEA